MIPLLASLAARAGGSGMVDNTRKTVEARTKDSLSLTLSLSSMFSGGVGRSMSLFVCFFRFSFLLRNSDGYSSRNLSPTGYAYAGLLLCIKEYHAQTMIT